MLYTKYISMILSVRMCSAPPTQQVKQKETKALMSFSLFFLWFSERMLKKGMISSHLNPVNHCQKNCHLLEHKMSHST